MNRYIIEFNSGDIDWDDASYDFHFHGEIIELAEKMKLNAEQLEDLRANGEVYDEVGALYHIITKERYIRENGAEAYEFVCNNRPQLETMEEGWFEVL